MDTFFTALLVVVFLAVMGFSAFVVVQLFKGQNRSAPGDPPGSRVVTHSRPRMRKRSASKRACVDLLAPSPPSSVMKRPRRTSFAGSFIEAAA